MKCICIKFNERQEPSREGTLTQPCAQPCVTAPAAVKPPRISQGCTEGLRPTAGWGCPIGHGLPYASSLPYVSTSAPHRVLRPFLATHGWIIFSLGGCCVEEGKRVGSRLGGRGRGDALRVVLCRDVGF